jgi:hypothetical protein
MTYHYLGDNMIQNHDCNENRITNCDGEVHTHLCSICGTYLGETECPERGS